MYFHSPKIHRTFAYMGLRQEKFARQIQKDIGELLQQNRHDWLLGEFVTVSGVRVSPDLSHARIYLSMFNSSKRQQIMESIELNSREIRMELARRLKNQVKKIPELTFFEDDSLDYVSRMEKIFDDIKKNNPHQENDSDS